MSSSSRKRPDLIERIRYPNPLPLPPFPPKLLKIPTPAERYADPSWSSRLAASVPFPLIVDGEGGMPLDLNAFPELWATDAHGRPVDSHPPAVDPMEMNAEDAWLLNPELANAQVPPPSSLSWVKREVSAADGGAASAAATGTSTPHMEGISAKDVGWLRRTEYLGADRKAKAEAAVRNRPLDKSSQEVSPSAEAARIEATFEAVEQPFEQLRHPTKRDIRPVESFEVYPDFDTWATEMHVFKFSDAPGKYEDSKPVVDHRLPLSLLRSRIDPYTGRPLISYYLPASTMGDVTLQEFDEILLADPDAFDEEDRAFFQDQAGELDDAIREAAVIRREQRRRARGFAGESQEPLTEEDAEDEEKMTQWFREQACNNTPYKHQRDYDADPQGSEEEWSRLLVLNFDEPKSDLESHLPLLEREAQKVAGPSSSSGSSNVKKVHYHPIVDRSVLRVKRVRRNASQADNADHWINVALTHKDPTEREQLKRLHRRAKVDLLDDLSELEESESEEKEEEEVVEAKNDEGQTPVPAADSDEEDEDEDGPIRKAPHTNGAPRRAAAAESDDDEEEPTSTSKRAATPTQPSTTQAAEEQEEDGAGEEEDDDDDDDDKNDSDEEVSDAESIDADEELAALAEEAGGESAVLEDEGGRGGRRSRRAAPAPVAPADEDEEMDD